MQVSNQNIFNQGMSQIENKGEALNKKMEEMLSSGKDISPESMLQIQFEMGQYNALVEGISTITKSLNDTAKSLAQRAG